MLLKHIHVHGDAAAHLTDHQCTAVKAGLCQSNDSKEKVN